MTRNQTLATKTISLRQRAMDFGFSCHDAYWLLSTNSKILKNEKLGDVMTMGLSFSPKTSANAGIDVCKHSVPACVATCVLKYAGRQQTQSVRSAADTRTLCYAKDRDLFNALLKRDLTRLQNEAAALEMMPVFRPDTASDCIGSADLANDWPGITMYGYTKDPARAEAMRRGALPSNYEVTYSYAGRRRGEQQRAAAQLRADCNVAIVFDTAYNPSHGIIGDLPKRVKLDGKSWRVVDGDKHDLRLRKLDGAGVVVGLRFKGKRSGKRHALAVRNGFIWKT